VVGCERLPATVEGGGFGCVTIVILLVKDARTIHGIKRNLFGGVE
jgi:hypothetical protein